MPGVEIETYSGLALASKYSCNAVQATSKGVLDLATFRVVYVGKSFFIAVDGVESQAPHMMRERESTIISLCHVCTFRWKL